jgi:hypothetical protein
MGGNRFLYGVLFGKFAGREHLEDLSVDERIILKYILKTQIGTA